MEVMLANCGLGMHMHGIVAPVSSNTSRVSGVAAAVHMQPTVCQSVIRYSIVSLYVSNLTMSHARSFGNTHYRLVASV